jgi:hypothetical protein
MHVISAFNALTAKLCPDNGEVSYSAAGNELIQQCGITVQFATQAGTMQIAYQGQYATDDGNIEVLGVSVLFPGETTPATALFPSSSRSAVIAPQTEAVATITAPALSAGAIVKVRHIIRGATGKRPPYNKIAFDDQGPDLATFATRGNGVLATTVDSAAWAPGTLFSQSITLYRGYYPTLRATLVTPSSHHIAYIATHSWGNENYDQCENYLSDAPDSGKYENNTIWGRLLAKKSYAVVVDAQAGGTGAAINSEWSHPQRQAWMDEVAASPGGIVWDHYWINQLRGTGQTASSAIQGLMSRAALYNTKNIPVWLSTPTPMSASTDNFVTVANQTEWAGIGISGSPGGLLVQWQDADKWVRGVAMVQAGNLADVTAGTIPSSGAGLLGVEGYVDVLAGALSPDRRAIYQPVNRLGVASDPGTAYVATGDGLHPAIGLARRLQTVNPAFVGYTLNPPASIVVAETMQVERGGSRPLPVQVLDSEDAGIGAATITTASEDTDIATIGASEVTDGSGNARFEGAGAITVPTTATVGDTVDITLTASPVQAIVTVEVVEELSSSGSGGSLINGGLIG